MTDVTIITPFFNTQDYLHKNIKSVLSQQDVELQLILIDDGSTDNSARIAKNYQESDDRVMLISQENQGQGPARNKAIEVADSEFVYFVDSDDYLGENSLSKLVNSARENELDLCSPGVPAKYFEKRLELIPCLPCKSQFMKLDIINKYQIRQPDARSGQDGVFSHLFLTQCNRIGMNQSAHFHYTAQRPGSTFTKYKSLHSFVPSIIETHLSSIIDFYDTNDLWDSNSDRLLMFLGDETFNNRIIPHISKMTAEQIQQCTSIVESVFNKAVRNLKVMNKRKDPFITSVKKFIDTGSTDTYSPPNVSNLANNNFYKQQVKIVKFWNNKLAPKGNLALSPSNQHQSSPVTSSGLKGLENKLDFLINVVNNNSYMIASSLRPNLPQLPSERSEIVVSLTTLPSRVGSLELTLTSLLKQSSLPDKIVVWLTDTIDKDYIPASVLAFEQNGVEFRFVKDVGPHTKLLYALKEFQNSRIITVDDDIIYPPNMIKCLLSANNIHPHSICANWVRELAFNKDGEVLGIRDGNLLTPPLLESNIEQKEKFVHAKFKYGFPYGTGGVLYPPNAFDDVVFDVALFSELCPKEDDIWFKVCSLLKGTKVVPTNLGINPKHHCIFGTQAEALRHHNHNHNEGGNLVQMRKVFDHFSINGKSYK